MEHTRELETKLHGVTIYKSVFDQKTGSILRTTAENINNESVLDYVKYKVGVISYEKGRYFSRATHNAPGLDFLHHPVYSRFRLYRSFSHVP